jgi:hypothetical protein
VESAVTADPLTAALDQLAAHREHLSQLDAREAGHFAAVSERLAELAGLIATMGRTLQDDAAAMARLEILERQVTELAARLGGPGGDGKDRYQPGPAPAWQSLAPAERQSAVAGLRAWVEEVYRPGYGHLAATLGPCWERHDLCLYGLDILSQLWSALYLQPARSTALLSAQAEYQARILPALATQLMTETSGCNHHPARSQPAGYTWSMP